MSSNEDLQNELEVSKRIIRVLTKDLLEAEKKIKALEASNSIPLPAAQWVSEIISEEIIGHTSHSSRQRSTRVNGQSEGEIPAFIKLDQDELQESSSEATCSQLRAQLASLEEERDRLMSERDTLQELVNQSQDDSHKMKKYKEKYKTLKSEIEAVQTMHGEAEYRLECERHAAVEAYLQLSDRHRKRTNCAFNPGVLMMEINGIKACQRQERTIKTATDPHQLIIPQYAQHLLRKPGCDPLRLYDDGVWRHPSKSYFLTLDFAYTYDPDGEKLEDRLQAFIPKAEGFQADLFCFHRKEGVWKYYGVFACVGSQTTTFSEAKEQLRIPQETLDVLARRLADRCADQRECKWAHEMYMKGIFKIVCTGFRRIEFSGKLVTALNPVPIPTPGQGVTKRKNPPTTEPSQRKRGRGKK